MSLELDPNEDDIRMIQDAKAITELMAELLQGIDKGDTFEIIYALLAGELDTASPEELAEAIRDTRTAPTGNPH